jgi:hypothetical protein
MPIFFICKPINSKQNNRVQEPAGCAAGGYKKSGFQDLGKCFLALGALDAGLEVLAVDDVDEAALESIWISLELELRNRVKNVGSHINYVYQKGFFTASTCD